MYLTSSLYIGGSYPAKQLVYLAENPAIEGWLVSKPNHEVSPHRASCLPSHGGGDIIIAMIIISRRDLRPASSCDCRVLAMADKTRYVRGGSLPLAKISRTPSPVFRPYQVLWCTGYFGQREAPHLTALCLASRDDTGMHGWAHHVPRGLEGSMEAARSSKFRARHARPRERGDASFVRPRERVDASGWVWGLGDSCGWMGLGRVTGGKGKLGIVSC